MSEMRFIKTREDYLMLYQIKNKIGAKLVGR